ncbi:MAG: hypothetical protein SO013_01160 [Prevotella sp.]|nr:hypothetical protein [Prevotellaceae bacterium]MDY3364539.1 hypothetical protein [Prevotella sp.]MDY3851491.1 hypothetical protein [Prevotella sp.]
MANKIMKPVKMMQRPSDTNALWVFPRWKSCTCTPPSSEQKHAQSSPTSVFLKANELRQQPYRNSLKFSLIRKGDQ